jgi:hypothetical protein
VDLPRWIDVKVGIDQMGGLYEMQKCQELGAGLLRQFRHMPDEFGVESGKNLLPFSDAIGLIVIMIAHRHLHFSILCDRRMQSRRFSDANVDLHLGRNQRH